MRIALLTPGISPYVIGGLQRHSFNLAKGLARNGVKVDLYHTDFENAVDLSIDDLSGITNLEKKNIENLVIPWPKNDSFPGHYIRSLKLFSNKLYQQYCQRSPVDFIYGQSLTAWCLVREKRKGETLPPIGVNLHGFEMFQRPANIRSYLENQLLFPAFYRHATEADYLFSFGGRITELIQEQLHIDNGKIIEIPGGIDSSWLVNQTTFPADPIRFIFLGRYERRKGIQEVQAAILQNPEWISHATFRFIGPIPEAKRLKLPHVSYANVIRDETLIQHELRQADILLCPSHSEGMPNVILEGMASGLAILATDVGAVRLLVDSDNGILLPKANVSGVIQGIDEFLRIDKAKIKRMKKFSLDRVKSFTWDRITAQTLSEIRKIISV